MRGLGALEVAVPDEVIVAHAVEAASGLVGDVLAARVEPDPTLNRGGLAIGGTRDDKQAGVLAGLGGGVVAGVHELGGGADHVAVFMRLLGALEVAVPDEVPVAHAVEASCRLVGDVLAARVELESALPGGGLALDGARDDSQAVVLAGLGGRVVAGVDEQRGGADHAAVFMRGLGALEVAVPNEVIVAHAVEAAGGLVGDVLAARVEAGPTLNRGGLAIGGARDHGQVLILAGRA